MASTPSILITGSSSGAGTAGQSKTDCVAAETITLSDSANSSGTYSWELWTVDGSAVTLTGANTATPTFTAAADESYLAFCTVDGVKSYSTNAAGERVSSQGGIAVLTSGERAPVPGETDQFGGWNTPLDNILADYRAGNLGGAATDHGVLTGLADDDHTQYLLANGTRNLTGNLTVSAGVTIDGRDLSADGTTLDTAVLDADFSASSGLMRKASAGTYAANDTIPAGVGTTVTTVTDGATLTLDCSLGNSFVVTLGGNRTVAAPTNPRDGQTIVFKIIQDGTGSRTLTWNATFNWPGGTAPTLSTAASSVDIVSAWYDGTSWYATSSLDFS